MLDESTVDEYLLRIGATRPEQPDLAALRRLQERHVLSVPFENLDYHLDREISMGPEVIDKIVHQRRGGGCYETNPAFAFLLESLGYQVEILPGQVYRYGRLGPPMCHLMLRVTLDEPWLVDTGFGRSSRLPLRFGTDEPQTDPHGVYRVVPVDDGGYDVLLNDKPQYRVGSHPAQLPDFRPTLWWYRTCPDSPFLQDVFCSVATENGRITLKGNQLTIVEGDQRRTEELPDDQTVLDAYQKHFGFSLDRLPGDPIIPEGGTIGIQL